MTVMELSTDKPTAPKKGGTLIARHFTQVGQDPLDEVTWVKRRAVIAEPDGTVVFEMDDVEVPESWSQLATDILASKYLRKAGVPGTGHETSARQAIQRITAAITCWGLEHGYFDNGGDAHAFDDELVYLLVNQVGAFNSPAWFNVGLHEAYGISGNSDPHERFGSAGRADQGWAWDAMTDAPRPVEGAYERPRSAACFILRMEDSLESIFETAKNEAFVFKYGSGSGLNASRLRSRFEKLSGGGNSSGMLSFLKVLDAGAGSIKSGGTTRRAAKMVCVDVDHPEVMDFITWKVREEEKVRDLLATGKYGSDFNGEAYQTVSGQNANNSVRVTDEFMRAVEAGGDWQTKRVTDGAVHETLPARQVWRAIAEAAWACADPGVQFDTTINDWHTVSNTDRIFASNPCCFTGDMLVDTSEGRLSFVELTRRSVAGLPLPLAFSWDHVSGRPVLRQINRAWEAGRAQQLVRVVTDKGLELTCTPEHKFLTYDGQWVPANELWSGQRLRKIAREVNSRRSGRISIFMKKVTNDQRVSQARWVWEQVFGPIPRGQHVHHVNGDPTDDRLSNLELRDGREHVREHSSGASNPRYLDVDIADLRAVVEEVFGRPKGTYRRSGHFTVNRWNAAVRKLGLLGCVPLANQRGVQGLVWEEWERRVVDLVAQADNDRVAAVVPVASGAPVYDIEVEGTHNFGVSNEIDPARHTVVVSNSEFMFLDDTACNLASLNLMKFRREDGSFNVEDYRAAIRVFALAQEILVDYSSYPTRAVAQNSHDYRPLGLGYANLGTLLMTNGLAYDSEEGRTLAAALTSVLCGEAYVMSAEVAQRLGPFAGFKANETPMLNVIEKHRSAARTIEEGSTYMSADLVLAARMAWDDALFAGQKHGYRNAQMTVLAPTGTIGLLMDCDTTGVEPEYSLRKSKKLAGGGVVQMTNPNVAVALRALKIGLNGKSTRYGESQVQSFLAYLDEHGTLEDAPGLVPDHLPVFDTAASTKPGGRCLTPLAHIKMLAAVQPFISGSISKTVNCPNSTTVEEIEELHLEAWKRGLKCIAVYRDGSKGSQPLNAGKGGNGVEKAATGGTVPSIAGGWGVKRPLPMTRAGTTVEARVAGHKLFLRSGEYADGSLGEIFIDMHKEGAPFRAMMNNFAIAVSIGLQHGVPLKKFVEMFTFARFEPAGMTDHPNVRQATSILDFIFRLLGMRYLGDMSTVQVPPAHIDINGTHAAGPLSAPATVGDAPICSCGHITVRNGNCFRCLNCGDSLGCS